MQGEKVKKIHVFWNWLGRNWFKCLVVILGIGFTYAYIITHYKLKAVDKYTMMVDLTLIILAFIAIAGGIVFLLIRRGVEDRAREITDETQDFIRAEVLTNLGYSWWKHYELSLEGKGEEASTHSGDPPQDYLDLAIDWTRQAAKHIDKLPVNKHDDLRCMLRNNLAYYLAEKTRLGTELKKGDIELAKAYACYSHEKISKFPQHREAWADTWEFVKSYIT